MWISHFFTLCTMKTAVLEKDTAEYVDRHIAAKMLNVSTRTLDRYLRKNILKNRKKNNRVYVRKSDVENYIHQYKIDDVEHHEEKKEFNFTNQVFERKSEESPITDNISMISSIDNKKQIQVYKTLYYEFKQDLEKKSEKLEMANYRIGELETRLKNTTPTVEVNEKENKLKDNERKLGVKIEKMVVKNANLEKKLRHERFNKIVYIALLSFLMITAPLIVFYSVITS